MTIITSTMLSDMHARRESGESVADIAARYNVKTGTVYQQFSRNFGGTPLPGPANDNNPRRKTHMTPRNGGCSTLSGLMPVSVPRVIAAANDNYADLAAGQAVNDYALRSGRDVQVAA